MEHFIGSNLATLMSDQAALPYQWYGGKGFIAVGGFFFMKIFLGKYINHLFFNSFIDLMNYVKYNIIYILF